MQSMTYGNGDVINYTYNDKYLLTQKSSGDTVIAEYKYDSRGNIIELDDRSAGVVYTYEYDQLNRAVAINCSDGTRYGVSYDDKSRVSLKVYDIAGTDDIEGTTFKQGYRYNSANLISSSQFNGEEVASYTYDSALRLTSKKLNVDNDYNVKYNYIRYSDGQLSSLIDSIQNGDNTLSYTYDERGNIATVSENGTLLEAYEYDKLNQLTKVTSGSDVYEYTYDNGGNISFVKKNGTAVKTYGYDTNWCDKLTLYNGAAITYDNIGNPLTYYNGDRFTWQNGRQLARVRSSALYGTLIRFTYDDSGKRTSKTYAGVDSYYYYAGDNLISSTFGAGRLDYFYGADGTPEGFTYTNNDVTTDNGTYYYVKNAQGDILEIINEDGDTVVKYSYDAWGKSTVVESTSSTIVDSNPFRYRGYVYDSETGYYYLNSRYYDPETGRFINADGYVSTGQGILGNNMFAYCGNNPVNNIDPKGTCPYNGTAADFHRLEYGLPSLDCTCLPYKTQDEAALAALSDCYSITAYSRHESGSAIYSSTSAKGAVSYDYVEPFIGNPHNIDLNHIEVPKNTIKVATVHAHPNNPRFSPDDITLARFRDLDSYVVGPGLQPYKFDVSAHPRDSLIDDFKKISTVPLTSQQKAALVAQCRDSWYAHLPKCKEGCNKIDWPKP